MHNFNSFYGMGFGGPASMGLLGILLLPFLVWSLFWKGVALWHAAQRGQGWWFVILLVVNTAGILEIVYLFAVLKLKLSQLFENHKELSKSE